MSDWLLGIAGAAAGYLLKALKDWFLAYYQGKREREGQRLERREAFELESLSRLDSDLDALTYNVCKAHLAGNEGATDDGMANHRAVGDDLFGKLVELRSSVDASVQLILDDALREQVYEAANAMFAVPPLKGQQVTTTDATAKWEAAATDLALARRAIGARIRGIYLSWNLPLESSPTRSSRRRQLSP